MQSTTLTPERVFLLGVLHSNIPSATVEEQMHELAELTRTAGGVVVASELQRRSTVDPALFVGRGKVAEISERRPELNYDLLICNEELSPRQQRNLEKELGVRVIDRTDLILDIFAQHARTREGGLQVEVARLRHWLPRLIGAYTYSRQVGGIGARGGPGEQQIELERRRVRRRMSQLERELEEVRIHRRQQRRRRRNSALPLAAIVGYTNAGKSTLLNALTGAEVRSENQLFATLDPTTRRWKAVPGSTLLLTDTVGFIQQLPTELVAAFRATLEEVSEADVILQVADATAPAALQQAKTVDEVLHELEADGKPRVVALNKMDCLGPMAQRRAVQLLSPYYSKIVPISALTELGLSALGSVVHEASNGLAS
ncbi:MAG: GTPase HflX [Candidatus Dormibacteraceae bacterium]